MLSNHTGRVHLLPLVAVLLVQGCRTRGVGDGALDTARGKSPEVIEKAADAGMECDAGSRQGEAERVSKKISASPPRFEAALPVAEVSSLQIPIEIPLSKAKAVFEAAIPQSQRMPGAWTQSGPHGANCWRDWAEHRGCYGFKYQFNRSPVAISASGNAICLSVHFDHVRFAVRKQKRVLGTSPLVEGTTNLFGGRATVSFTPSVDAEWRPQVSVDAVVADLHGPVTLSDSYLGIVSVDVTQKANAAFKRVLNGQVEKFAKKVGEEASIRQQVEKLWNQLQQPVPFELRPGNQARFVLNPQSLGVSSIAVNGDDLVATVSISALPYVTVGAVPTVEVKPLPAPTSHGSGNRFSFQIPAKVSLKALTEVIRGALASEAGVRLPARGEPHVEVKDVEAYAQGTKLVLKVELKGDPLWAEIFLAGTPAIDSANGTIFFPDLDYTIESKDLVSQMANGLLDDNRKSLIALL
ncbi:MAG: DUF4403 family protein, partial [Myxococcota bacterium]|nr:DUF4403 family protein [Myxococcota bacterium]